MPLSEALWNERRDAVDGAGTVIVALWDERRDAIDGAGTVIVALWDERRDAINSAGAVIVALWDERRDAIDSTGAVIVALRQQSKTVGCGTECGDLREFKRKYDSDCDQHRPDSCHLQTPPGHLYVRFRPPNGKLLFT